MNILIGEALQRLAEVDASAAGDAPFIVPLGVVHYFLLVKADKTSPLIYGGLVLLLLGWRVWDRTRKRPTKPRRAQA